MKLSLPSFPAKRDGPLSFHGKINCAVEHYLAGAEEEQGGIWGLRHKSQPMTAIRAQNVDDDNGMDVAKGAWGAPDSPKQENAAGLSVHRPSNGNPRAPLANGNSGLNPSQQLAQNPDSNYTLSNSESDSLLNLYGDFSASNPNLAPPREEDQIPENMYRPEDHDPDPEKWIHRDKLAKIESEELQAAGFRLAQQSLSKVGRRAESRDRLGPEPVRTEQTDRWAPAGNKERRPRVSSPVDGAAESPDSGPWDLRTPEEIAANDATHTVRNYSTPGIRKSGSKIPVLTSSPLPIPPERLDRDTPMPRKRNFSGSLEEDEMLITPRVRTRGGSVGSQNLLDETQASNGTPPSANHARSGNNSAGATSPILAKAGVKAASPAATTTPSSATRKITPAGVGKATNTHKPRVPSSSNNGSPLPYPSNRSTDPDRPRTAVNRPEGEAPWIATMYKPDPRLPQEKQIIPTHVKKQQQQQQQGPDKDGSTAGTYDLQGAFPAQPESEELKQPFNQPSPSPPTPDTENKEDNNAWPLKPVTSIRSTTTSRPGTSGSGMGGYTTMPKVISSPLNSPPVGALASPGSSTIPQDAPQPSPPGDQLDKRKERSCGCCIVM